MNLFGFQTRLSEQELLAKYHELREKLKYPRFSFENIEQNLPLLFEMEKVVDAMETSRSLKLDFYHYVAEEYMLANIYKEPIRLLQKYLNLARNSSDTTMLNHHQQWKQRMSYDYGLLARAYAQLDSLDKADGIHRQNIDFSKISGKIIHASSINNYGLFLLDKQVSRDSSLYYFERALLIMGPEGKQNHLYGSIVDNIADVFMEIGNKSKARDLYLENFEFYQQVKIPSNNKIDASRLISAGCQFINASIDLEIFDGQIDIVYRKLSDIVAGERSHNLQLNDKLEFYQMQEKLMKARGNISEAYESSKQVMLITDSLEFKNVNKKMIYNEVVNDHYVNNIRNNYNREKLMQLEQIDSQRLKIWIISLLSIIVVGFLSFLVYRRRKQVVAERNNKLIAEKNFELTSLKNVHLQNEISAKKRDLSDFAINLSENQQWAKELAAKLEGLKMSKGRARGKKWVEIEEELSNKLKFDAKSNLFYKRLDELSHSFYNKLLSHNNNLTKTDKRICSLIRLNMSSEDIASLQNISISSLNTSRYRLRKKFNLREDENLDDFINGL